MEFINFTDVILILVVFYLSGRIKRLEKRLNERPATPPPVSTSVFDHTGQPRPQTAPPAAAAIRPDSPLAAAFNAPSAASGPLAAQVAPEPIPPYDGPQTADDVDRLVTWLKDNWLLKLGALLLLIGFGWLATYAFMNNWIGPVGRIALGITAGAVLLVLGAWRIREYKNQGSIFLVLGSSVILVTVFAAREVYDFFTPLSALALMFLSTATVALMSVRYKVRSLALVSLILACVAPLLTNSPDPDMVSLFSYLFAVVLGAIWIVALTGYRELTLTALIIVAAYSLPELGSASEYGSTLLLFAYGFTTLFFLTNTLGAAKAENDTDLGFHLVTAIGNGLFLLAWVLSVAPDEWQSLLLSAWMVVFAAGGFIAYRLSGRREAFFAYAGVATVLLAAATAVELDGPALTIAYTIEAGLIPLISYLILGDRKAAVRSTLLLAVPVILSAQSLGSSAWYDSIWHEDLAVLVILGVTLALLAAVFRRLSDNEYREPSQLSAGLIIAASFYAHALIWLSLHAVIEDDTATMFSLVVYTIVGLGAYLSGRFEGKSGIKRYGAVMLALVIARLFLVDIWQMAMAGKIITFFMVGLLLMSTAFIGRNRKEPVS